MYGQVTNYSINPVPYRSLVLTAPGHSSSSRFVSPIIPVTYYLNY